MHFLGMSSQCAVWTRKGHALQGPTNVGSNSYLVLPIVCPGALHLTLHHSIAIIKWDHVYKVPYNCDRIK